MLEEYRRSLKMPEAEELFDLIFYRPLAYLFVKGVSTTPITPNHVTLLSLAFGLGAAYEFASGTPSAAIRGAILFAVANILDCADGQLARLQGSGTLLGRVVDGVADYIIGIAVFLSLGIGMAAGAHSAWWLVIAAGLSSAFHAMLFDHYQSEFICAARGEKNFLGREIGQFAAELSGLKNSGRRPAAAFILRLYLWYLHTQQKSDARSQGNAAGPELYRAKNRRLIRCWSFIGPTTNRTVLILCAAAARPDLYLWIVFLAGNLWCIVCRLLQRGIDRQLNRMTRGDHG